MKHSKPPRAVARFSLCNPFTARRLLAGGSKIALAVALAGALGCTSSRQSSQPSTSQTQQEKSYLQQIRITDAQMSAAKNFLGQTVTTLKAHVTNNGDKTISYLELELVFFNFDEQPALREKTAPIDASNPPLKPHAAREFQVSFDHVPDDWNQAPPRITPVSVKFATDR
jgi:Protein of unknown function (DUF2393)